MQGWTVVYIEDNDDSKSAQELKEKGYTLPEYHFRAKYRDVVSEDSGVVWVRGWVKIELTPIQRKILGGQKLTLRFADHTFDVTVSKDDENLKIVQLPIAKTWEVKGNG